MTKAREKLAKGKRIDVGIDVHKKIWSVCVLCEGEELYNAVLPAEVERLVRITPMRERLSTTAAHGATGASARSGLRNVQEGLRSTRLPRMTPAASSPMTAGCPIRSNTSPPSLAPPRITTSARRTGTMGSS